MKALRRIPALFMILLLGMSAFASPKCPETALLFNELTAGTKPKTNDYPDFRTCGTGLYETELAHAVATFVAFKKQNGDRQKRSDVADVLAQIRDGHNGVHGVPWPNSYDTFARALALDLASTTWKFTIPPDAKPADFNSLDTFIKELKELDLCDTIDQIVAETLKTNKLPSGFAPPIRCSVKFYTNLAVAWAPKVLDDLAAGTSGTASFLESIRDSSQGTSMNSSQQIFGAKLRERLLKRGAPLLPHLREGNGSQFLDRLLQQLRIPPPPPPPESIWWKITLTVFAILTFVNSAILIYLLRSSPWRRQGIKTDDELTRNTPSLEKRIYTLEINSPTRKELDGVTERLELVGAEVRQITEHLADWEIRLSAIESKSFSDRDLAGLLSRVDTLDAAVRESQDATPTTLRSSLPLEREALGEVWKKFRENKELLAAVESGTQDSGWQKINGPLLVDLPPQVPEDIKATFDAVLAPARDYHNLISKISLVPRLVNDELPRLGSEAQELSRLREFMILLTMVQNSKLVADRLEFRVKSWIIDHFLSFADLFLQKCQIARFEKRDAPLQSGLQIVLQILDAANLKPVELTLGQTRFDSAQHIGRSTTCDPRFEDGVILSAVRNGFLQGGQQVIRKPEVIVNRVR